MKEKRKFLNKGPKIQASVQESQGPDGFFFLKWTTENLEKLDRETGIYAEAESKISVFQ